MKRLRKFGISLLAVLALVGIASAQKWTKIKHPGKFPAGAMILLTDGTVLIHEEQDSNYQTWYKLTPDNTGSYINGTLSPIATRRRQLRSVFLRLRGIARRSIHCGGRGVQHGGPNSAAGPIPGGNLRSGEE